MEMTHRMDAIAPIQTRMTEQAFEEVSDASGLEGSASFADEP